VERDVAGNVVVSVKIVSKVYLFNDTFRPIFQRSKAMTSFNSISI
jgi:hypothetical protein